MAWEPFPGAGAFWNQMPNLGIWDELSQLPAAFRGENTVRKPQAQPVPPFMQPDPSLAAYYQDPANRAVDVPSTPGDWSNFWKRENGQAPPAPAPSPMSPAGVPSARVPSQQANWQDAMVQNNPALPNVNGVNVGPTFYDTSAVIGGRAVPFGQNALVQTQRNYNPAKLPGSALAGAMTPAELTSNGATFPDWNPPTNAGAVPAKSATPTPMTPWGASAGPGPDWKTRQALTPDEQAGIERSARAWEQPNALNAALAAYGQGVANPAELEKAHAAMIGAGAEQLKAETQQRALNHTIDLNKPEQKANAEMIDRALADGRITPEDADLYRAVHLGGKPFTGNTFGGLPPDLLAALSFSGGLNNQSRNLMKAAQVISANPTMAQVALANKAKMKAALDYYYGPQARNKSQLGPLSGIYGFRPTPEDLQLQQFLQPFYSP